MPDDPHDEWHHAGPAGASDPYAVIRRWEKLRLLYNAVLVPWTVLLIAVLPGGGTAGPADVFVGGLVANACFCAGPVAEAYLVGVGAPARAARGWLFALGTGFTALAALLALSL